MVGMAWVSLRTGVWWIGWRVLTAEQMRPKCCGTCRLRSRLPKGWTTEVLDRMPWFGLYMYPYYVTLASGTGISRRCYTP